MTVPRGIRNNNPGNIERTGERWLGMAADQSGDPRFVVFEAPEWGIRAICRIIRTYVQRHGKKTLREIVSTWAPPTENHTGAYIGFVAARAGLDPARDAVDPLRHAHMRPIVEAIISMENGRQPYPPAVIDEGLRRAGIDVPRDR